MFIMVLTSRKSIPVLTLLFSLLFSALFSQDLNQQVPYFTYGKGLGITSPDSLFMMNIRFRMQNRIGVITESGSDWGVSEIEARVRRLRLRFDGYVYNPKLTYVIQLAFTRGDIDFEDSQFPNIIRDAMVIYNFTNHFALGIGQTKLPGNRQRVNSSGDLQLPDRSIVNSVFNIDRDFGIQAYYRNNIKGLNYVLRGAISSGEGRNFNDTQNGLAYTGRIELLPFGEFTNNGDYFEGDLEREPKPKLSFGGGFSNNENAVRSGGQLGKFLYEQRDIETTMLDFLFKHNGWAFATEYLIRYAHDPITQNPEDPLMEQHVFIGQGQNYQGSYLFRNNYELIARYSTVVPHQKIEFMEPTLEQYTLGATKYLKGHRVKLQTEFTFGRNTWALDYGEDRDYFLFRFQIEVGI